ncbi:MAG: hypothetical protein MAG451_02908 [Anaerolineales bacterium]|nr:hypothetical protein [Anaerolineales bacterium]
MTENPVTAANRSRAAWAETFEPVLSELREQIRQRDPEQTAVAADVSWHADKEEFRLHCLGCEYRLTWPALVPYPVDSAEDPCDANLQGILLYYLSMADGTPLAGKWIAFRELPDGWLYHQAFQGYTGDELVRAWGNDVDAFIDAAEQLGGWEIDIGDAGYAFEVMPRVRMAVVYWLGDDEFPPNAKVLFDESAGHYLTTDGLAVLGHHFMHQLLKASQLS